MSKSQSTISINDKQNESMIREKCVSLPYISSLCSIPSEMSYSERKNDQTMLKCKFSNNISPKRVSSYNLKTIDENTEH